MTTKQLVALSLVLASSGAMAQRTLDTVQVRAESKSTLSIACKNPAKPKLKDVERVLAITDSTQTASLRSKLMGAAAEACKAGEPRIQVTRDVKGKSLTWKAVL